MKPDAVQQTLLDDLESKRQMAEIERDGKERAALADGPYVVYIKRKDGTIQEHRAVSLWRLIFGLTQILDKKYSAQMLEGVTFKIIKQTKSIA